MCERHPCNNFIAALNYNRIYNGCKSDATTAIERQTVLNQQVAVTGHHCGFYVNAW